MKQSEEEKPDSLFNYVYESGIKFENLVVIVTEFRLKIDIFSLCFLFFFALNRYSQCYLVPTSN